MTSAESFTKARFWKCALQVNPASYITHRGQEQSLSDNDYNQQLLKACKEADIAVIGLANHGSVDGVDAIRTLLTSNGIVVFPGFEIASSEKVHFVCLFDENTTSQQLERILGNLQLLDPEDGVRPSRLSSEQLIEAVNRADGFLYAAHSTNDSGLLRGRFNHIWIHPQLKAAQISGSIDDLRDVESGFYRNVFLNKLPEYRRERPMAAINAKDVTTPEEVKLNTSSCLIKMTRPSFGAFRQAFLDPESRVRLNSDVPENFASAIEAVRFVGGYLDGVQISFSDHLNAVIGGRGTGKSTLIESIRFAMELRPFGKNAKQMHDDIVKENLGKEGALVELSIRSAVMGGRRFTISRKYGDKTVVKDDKGALAPHTPRDLLPQLEIFGQNEIYEMTQDVEGYGQLVHRFIGAGQDDLDTLIQKIRGKLRENREAIVRAYQSKAEIESEVELLPKLEDQAKQFQSLGIEKKLQIVPLLEKEKQLSGRVTTEIGQLAESLQTVKDSMPDPAFLSEAAISKLPHAALLRKQRSIIEHLSKESTAVIANLETLVNNSLSQNLSIASELSKAIGEEEHSLETAFKEIPASQGKSGREIGLGYQRLLRQIETITPKQTILQQRRQVLEELQKKRKLVLAELSEAQAERSAILQKAVKRLNRKLDGKLRLTIGVEANREPLVKFLGDCAMDGVGAKRLTWASEGDFSPANLAATIRDGEDALKQQNWGLVPTVVSALTKLSVERLLLLEEIERPDNIYMELNVAHGTSEANFRELDRLSTGQQCTAILHLLLLDNRDPLILDQPEDNLDNAFIADRIVAELRQAKVARQFLFATHNANIPVFGDAEWIGVFNVVDGKGEIPSEQQGAIDVPVIQKLAADILEGGKSAFNQRREKYGFE